ncbi:MAG TPA: carbohydrate ABC transporter permease [Solirubrobacteraceae bacterium]|nr:carbohydrate ABC transporter permease [Solirubrobacteraceae bacterium]
MSRAAAERPAIALQRTGRRPRRRWPEPASIVRALVLLLFFAITAYPILLVVSTAFKNPLDVTLDPFSLFSSFHPQNFVDAWNEGGFQHYFVTTVIITVPSVLGIVALSTLAGYALARVAFPGRSIVFFTIMLGLMIPFFSYMIPLFFELKTLHLLNHKLGVILAIIAGATGTGLPLGVFLMRAFFYDLPNELADAGRVDGASEWGVFRHVMLPLAMPGAGVLAVLTFFATWNVFIVPLLYLPGQENRTLATGIYLFTSGRTQEVNLAAAGTLIMTIPVVVLFLLFQRQFIRGLTVGAVKG